MKQIRIEDAVGCILSHDVTKIVPGEFKGRLFKKGHIIKEEDIPKLLDIGKEHIYVWEPKENELHENDAAIRIKDLVLGENCYISEEIKEGKIDYISTFPNMYPATSYHFAKNLGIDVVKPDRHLLRISKKLGFKSPYDFCSEISHQSGDKISVIDLIFWRFANMNKNYLNELILKPL